MWVYRDKGGGACHYFGSANPPKEELPVWADLVCMQREAATMSARSRHAQRGLRQPQHCLPQPRHLGHHPRSALWRPHRTQKSAGRRVVFHRDLMFSSISSTQSHMVAQ
jgi:hypothetical protein